MDTTKMEYNEVWLWLTKGCIIEKDIKIPKRPTEMCKDSRDQDNRTSNIKRAKTDSEKQNKIDLERMNHIRNIEHIKTWGADISPLIESFEQLISEYKVSTTIVENLKNQKYSKPTAIQMQAWPLILEGREVLCCAPTGSGKTASYIIPIIHKLDGPKRQGFRSVILAPTRELARQIYNEFVLLSEGTGLKIVLLHSMKNVEAKLGESSAKKFDVLITTPKRCVYLLESNVIDLKKVELLVIDESDKLFEKGDNGFREQIATIYKACDSTNISRCLFSATCAPDVEEWCKASLNNLAVVVVCGRNTASRDVKQQLVFCGNQEDDHYAKELALDNIFNNSFEVPCLIFVRTIERATKLHVDLVMKNKSVGVIHSKIPNWKRDETILEFRRGKYHILISTEPIARGMDFRGINLVVNYDMPTSKSSYIHCIGRTGRAGRPGRAITFWTENDNAKLREIATVIKHSGNKVEDFIFKFAEKKAIRSKKLKNISSTKFKQEKSNKKSNKIKKISSTKFKKDKSNIKSIKNKKINSKKNSR